MDITVKALYVDGVELPTPAYKGVTITPNKLWSANAGRLENSGDMAGTIKKIKVKLEIKWPRLTREQVAVIENAVTNLTPFHTLKYIDMTGAVCEKTVYFGDPSYTLLDYRAGGRVVEDATVSAIEK